MTNKLYKTVKGEKVTLKASEVKSYIMKVNDWTEQQYNAERYKLKNRLRTYEAYRGTPQEKVQSPVNIMYFEARRKEQFRREQKTDPTKQYTPSFEMERLKAMPAYGNQKALSRAQQSGALNRRVDDTYRQSVLDRFKGFIKKNDMADYIVSEIEDPVKLEQALSDYADMLHEHVSKQKKDIDTGAIPIQAGEVYGSDTEFDFDINDYL